MVVIIHIKYAKYSVPSNSDFKENSVPAYQKKCNYLFVSFQSFGLVPDFLERMISGKAKLKLMSNSQAFSLAWTGALSHHPVQSQQKCLGSETLFPVFSGFQHCIKMRRNSCKTSKSWDAVNTGLFFPVLMGYFTKQQSTSRLHKQIELPRVLYEYSPPSTLKGNGKFGLEKLIQSSSQTQAPKNETSSKQDASCSGSGPGLL